MANPDHLVILKKSVLDWNQWRNDNPDIKPDLSSADLSLADLIEADLTFSSLSSANFTGANLSGADFAGSQCARAIFEGANLSMADFTKAEMAAVNLRRADLSGAQFSAADLYESDLTGATITGVCLYGTAKDNWKIDDIKCDYVFWDLDNKERTPKEGNFKEGEFEKKYIQFKNVVEIILDVPLSDLTHYAGQAIEKIANDKYSEALIFFKGQEALSNEVTQLKFLSFNGPEKINEIQNQLSDLEVKLNYVIKNTEDDNQPKNLIDIKEEIDIGKVLVVRPKEIQRKLIERYMTMSITLQRIVQVIQQTFNG
jgi:hypothetical protein